VVITAVVLLEAISGQTQSQGELASYIYPYKIMRLAVVVRIW
jgi:hypothetical protein